MFEATEVRLFICFADFDRNHCSLSSPSFLEWDAASVCLESVMARLFMSKAENKPEPQKGVDLLHNVLRFEADVRS